MVRSPSTSWLSATSAFASNTVFARRAATAATKSGRPSYAGDRRAVRRMPHAAPITSRPGVCCTYGMLCGCAAEDSVGGACQARGRCKTGRPALPPRAARAEHRRGRSARRTDCAAVAACLRPAGQPHWQGSGLDQPDERRRGRRRSRGYRRRGPVSVSSRPPGGRRCGVLGMLHVARRVCAVCSSSVCSSSRGGHAAATGRGLVMISASGSVAKLPRTLCEQAATHYRRASLGHRQEL
jgi:hypothetical protein